MVPGMVRFFLTAGSGRIWRHTRHRIASTAKLAATGPPMAKAKI
jgi:hypothetical protein